MTEYAQPRPEGSQQPLPNQDVTIDCENRLLSLEGNGQVQLATEGTLVYREVVAAGILPRGSAMITTSGNLTFDGIHAIIHAASGSMHKSGPLYKPTLDGVTDAVKNSMTLAQLHIDRFPESNRRVAIPFIGGKIFLGSIQQDIPGFKVEELAAAIIKSALETRGNLEVRFVTFGEEDTRLFQRALEHVTSELPKIPIPEEVAVLNGSLTDFSLHEAPIIVNAANMEVEFGGGLSGIIAQATGMPNDIDNEAKDLIVQFMAKTLR